MPRKPTMDASKRWPQEWLPTMDNGPLNQILRRP